MQVVIVGNGQPDRDYSEAIDSHDVVVRINNATHFSTGLMGRRTDVLFVRSAANPHGQLISTDAPKWRIPGQVVDDAKLFMVICSKMVCVDPDTEKPIHDYRVYLERHACIDNKMLMVLPTIGVASLRREANLSADPTAGAYAIRWALRAYPCKITLAGWFWNTCSQHLSHRYDEEQAWIRSLERDNRVSLLLPETDKGVTTE